MVSDARAHVEVRVTGAAADRRVILCDVDGQQLAVSPVTDGKASLPLGSAAKRATYVKLQRQGLLLDAGAIE